MAIPAGELNEEEVPYPSVDDAAPLPASVETKPAGLMIIMRFPPVLLAYT